MSNGKDTIIFDLDGTLALDHKRNHLLYLPHDVGCTKQTEDCNCKLRDWDAYFDACDTDEPNLPVIQICRALSETYRIVIFSGRSDTVRDKTEQWLFANEIWSETLWMRDKNDRTQDDVLKMKWMEEYGKHRIHSVFEDRNRVVKAWRDAGIQCFQVALTTF